MEIYGTQSILDSLISSVPAFSIALVGCVVWRFVCNAIHREAHAVWSAQMGNVSTSASIDIRIDDANKRLALALQGSPADRLFIKGLMIAVVVTLLTLVFYWVNQSSGLYEIF